MANRQAVVRAARADLITIRSEGQGLQDDQAERGPRHRSGTLAFGAAKGLEFGFERRPISAVLGLFGADLGVEGFAQSVAGARKGELKQGAAVGLSTSLGGEALG
jgi:hypothetical protein